MSFSEFLEWQEFLQQEMQQNTKRDWYLAQIAAEVHRTLVENPNNVKTSDFLLSFTKPVEEKVRKSKSAWASFLGVDLKEQLN